MINSIQNTTFQELSSLGSIEMPTRRLTIEFDKTDLVIHINNKYKPPISWFLTDNSGNLVKLGQISDQNFTISLIDVPYGEFSLRIAGEVHRISNHA